MKRKIIPYNTKLTELAKFHRNKSTKSEVILWLRIKGKALSGFDFHRQKPIDNFICDFFCYELMLAIEVDGLTHDWEEVQKKDEIKKARLQELGITILRFNDNEVLNDIENVIRTISGYIEEHTPTPL